MGAYSGIYEALEFAEQGQVERQSSNDEINSYFCDRANIRNRVLLIVL